MTNDRTEAAVRIYCAEYIVDAIRQQFTKDGAYQAVKQADALLAELARTAVEGHAIEDCDCCIHVSKSGYIADQRELRVLRRFQAIVTEDYPDIGVCCQIIADRHQSAEDAAKLEAQHG